MEDLLLEEEAFELSQMKSRLASLGHDLIQAQAGAVFDDLDSRITEFRQLHNEIRKREGKQPRKYS